MNQKPCTHVGTVTPNEAGGSHCTACGATFPKASPKPYASPRLEFLGSVNKLTLSASAGNKVDGSMKSKFSP